MTGLLRVFNGLSVVAARGGRMGCDAGSGGAGFCSGVQNQQTLSQY